MSCYLIGYSRIVTGEMAQAVLLTYTMYMQPGLRVVVQLKHLSCLQPL